MGNEKVKESITKRTIVITQEFGRMIKLLKGVS